MVFTIVGYMHLLWYALPFHMQLNVRFPQVVLFVQQLTNGGLSMVSRLNVEPKRKLLEN